MLSSNADVSRSLPARRAFTVATGPLAHTPLGPSSSSALSLPPPSPSQTACSVAPLQGFFACSDFWLFLVEGYPNFAQGPRPG
eukprot:1261822-Pleurochrysis_carterae.AAC.1